MKEIGVNAESIAVPYTNCTSAARLASKKRRSLIHLPLDSSVDSANEGTNVNPIGVLDELSKRREVGQAMSLSDSPDGKYGRGDAQQHPDQHQIDCVAPESDNRSRIKIYGSLNTVDHSTDGERVHGSSRQPLKNEGQIPKPPEVHTSGSRRGFIDNLGDID
ncbi:unnamed protein product [Clonostachys solani]|uniref:Uncharacterized protein n=1 Tax=Clonostachys solani TaxID=160281 RepID=A0A9N9Z1I3_9HYPO|nr:unnamed protein product [Clonostachys solani]